MSDLKLFLESVAVRIEEDKKREAARLEVERLQEEKRKAEPVSWILRKRVPSMMFEYDV